ncbi:MAG TPA: glycohydrolase toxin TNT-related protein [Amycolatopsis sp.]|uniref:TNT domain-containing protein n=1 Tax=Amycolatopsis sp. TaxID=37632 RepID=UPI002B4A0170|nr:glycohydrolase toxin TNT-related protein [Amycolatopsis sp.]HKS49471.1 glycohydrolase toxin TNT-related protein [Amycolatopsis sp.]
MATPTTQLNATEQDTLVKQIGLALLRAAPRDWRRVTAQYRAVGRYHELTGEVLTEDGTAQEWLATHDIATLFGRLRAGMYREGRGTWFNARYQLDHPSSYNLEYDRDEPRWNLAPPPQAYSDELRVFPRSEENIPEWLIRRLSGLGPEQPGPRFRMARIFDGQDANGRPVFNRPELDSDELDRLFEYLASAPVAVSERGLDLDRLAPSPVPKVPVAFHTDGVWIWPAAVNYYLQEYNIAPENELVAHIRSTGFSVPEVPEGTLQAAVTHLGRPVPSSPPPRPPRPAPEPTQVAPPVPPPAREHEPSYEEHFEAEAHEEEPEKEQHRSSAEQPTTFTPAIPADAGPPTVADPGPPTVADPGPAPAGGEPPEPDWGQAPRTPATVADPGPPTMAALPPERPEPREAESPVPHPEPARLVTPTPTPSAPPAVPSEPTLGLLRDRLDDLGVATSSYRIGEPAEHGWSLEKLDAGWRVGWYDQELTNPAVFGDVEDAAAFMLGKLLLDGGSKPVPENIDETQINGRRAAPPQHREEPPAPEPISERLDEPEPDSGPPTMFAPPVSPPPPPPAPRRDAPPRRVENARPAASAGSGGSGNQQWPVQPLSGEPPLTLFRGKEMRELPPGSELDRFGNPNGNLTYAAGTPFEERSLVPEWVNRPYHVYRVQRPLEALAGVAIPWFNQPGGGAAYLLPASIEELLADGDLVELDPGEPPID